MQAEPSIRKRLALFFGYSGQNYNGMQYQVDPKVKTIQNELIEGLFNKGFLRTNRFVELVKNYKWSRAARTDKGVHALINGISCLFSVPRQFVVLGEQGQEVDKEKMIDFLRKIFPQFTIYAIYEVQKTKFLMRQSVKSRVYCYICPIKLFETNTTNKQQILAKINRLCGYFIGTRNYHNYSSGIKAKDPSAKRYMISMVCKVHQKYDDWVRFQLHGQSFIYHQIRKMIGSIVQIFHEQQPQNFLQNTFFNNIIDIFLAPADGLYLKSLNFDSYNKNQHIPEKIVFDGIKDVFDRKQDELQEQIIEFDARVGNFQDWLKKIKNKEMQEQQKGVNIEIQE